MAHKTANQRAIPGIVRPANRLGAWEQGAAHNSLSAS